jgi:hypothetical protein
VPVELTSTWIPLSLLILLSMYMYVLFRRERRESLAIEAQGAPILATEPHHAPADNHTADHGTGHSALAVDHGHVAHIAAPETKKNKGSLIWRTAYLWLPLVAGFGWQAYLDFFRHMIEKTAGG